MKKAVAFVAISLTMAFLSAGVVSTFEQSASAQNNEDKKQKKQKKPRANRGNPNDAKNRQTGKSAPVRDPKYAKYGIYAKTAPVANPTEPVSTTLPLALKANDRIAFIGNTLLDRAQHFGQFETMLHQAHPKHNLVVRNLAWSADTPDLQPRPANFASVMQHLTHENADVIFAAFGFNESFAGPQGLPKFRAALTKYVTDLKSRAFNGKTGPRIVLLSPIANENVTGVPAADLNNAAIKLYADAVKDVAAELKVGYVDLYTATEKAMADAGSDLTINGAHLNEDGYALFAKTLFKGTFGKDAPLVNETIREVVLDKNRQYFRRYRPANTFYYTGGRNKSYGYLDFLPAMQNFEIMTANRDQRIWDLAEGKAVPDTIDDSNVPPLPVTKQSRGANRWKTAADELKDFKIDPRFEVNLFAGEEEFPDIAAPIQMRWDSKGRLWVACSTTYPHVYPGNEPNDKLVILEDTDGDGRADKSSVFADDLHIPLSFEFGDGGVYVSEMPDLTFLKDTDGDGKADYRRRVLTGFGTEDSHHSLHDITWTPDGDLIFRESIFHHTQVETPYGPVRQQNSGWFRFQPRDQRLISFGTYASTNPWGVTFDDWGQHMASHPIFASAFHALDPPYPTQHPRPNGLRAYSGTCGQEFVDFATFPDELRGHFIKVRYKPTNRVEIHKWVENEFGYDEEYQGDLLFSSNLSFIPVDLRYGPRGAMYVCDWYNPVKGHAQYSLRDDRRDRHSGRIWRITAKGKELQEPPKFDGAPIADLLEILKRPEYRYRYWAKRELRSRESDEVKTALDAWVAALDPNAPRFRHHQIEAIWTYRWIGKTNISLWKEVLACDSRHARAAAARQLRYWHVHAPDAIKLLSSAANDPSGLVRLEAAIAATYIGTREALDAMLAVLKYPAEKHLRYAITTSLGSHTLRRHWEGDDSYNIAKLLKKMRRTSALKEPTPSASQAQFDVQKDIKKVTIGCLPERMMYTLRQFTAKPGQSVKLVFLNADATDHNLVIVKPGALAEVGMAANEMAKDPRHASGDFIPRDKRDLILHNTPMIGPTRKEQVHVLRFNAPTEPGIYPYVCTFPGHWKTMNGVMHVVDDLTKYRQQSVAAERSRVEVE
ncbi:MAG: GDSL-type esterase/lipase family protein, partial [Pirellulales bacterium]|nr:GDSL-type esterase/lipase family protein [Pirellulales bacterium]